MQNLISRKDAARILGISIKTLDQARLNGTIAYVQFVENGCVYFTETAIEEYIAKCTRRAKPTEPPRSTYRKKRGD
jgi:predicted site-specific integrase-resolvase